jgi:ferrous iron transport protein B
MRTLRELKEGEKGIILRIRGKGEFRKRIIEMGFIKGKLVTVIKAAPLQDPVEYRILDSDVSLRLEEAENIDVISEQDAVQDDVARVFQSLVESPHVIGRKERRPGTIEVALVGNPNSGKTSLFNHASKSREHTGNYAGVTVDSKTAEVKIRDYTIRITDLPGTYSLTDYSPEELFVREHLLFRVPDIVINVVDASNLERNLYLTTQLIDLGVKVIVALNMYDELRLKGDSFDFTHLGSMIGIPFIPTVASKGQGIVELFRKVIQVHENKAPEVRNIQVNYGYDLEAAIGRISKSLQQAGIPEGTMSYRYLGIKLLEKDRAASASMKEFKSAGTVLQEVDKVITRLEDTLREDTETLVANARYGFIEGALKETYQPGTRGYRTVTQAIDQLLTGKYLGYPIFILLMWLMFEATFLIGDYPVQAIEFGVAQLGSLVDRIVPAGIVRDLLIEGVIGGVGGVIVFLPNILILFLFISLMEDTGYMARVAFIVDKLMHRIGLHGKSFIPLLMGFGCNVPAIMATRTIESKSDRMVTMLIIPFMSCSARYPVYILLISAFFVSFKGAILFSLYLIGIFLAVVIAFIFKKTLFKSMEVPFVMELPPYRMPTLKATLRHTWFKGAQYLRKMGTIILVASVVIWALGYFPIYRHDDTVDENTAKQIQQEQSFIGRLGKFIEPVIHPLGFDWRMGVSLIAGSAAKEVVVSTMGVLYQTESGDGISGLVEKLKTSVHNSGPNEGKPVYSPLVAYSLMVFILIYFPCIAVIAAVKKESGKWKWSAFLAFYTTAIAWLMAFIVYQGGKLIL